MSQTNKVYDASFEEWYKRHFNKNFNKNTDLLSRTENMSDEDFEVGTNLYNAYLQKDNLLSQYNQANTSLEQEKTQSQQQASIQLDKLKKYIPTQIKAQGLGGLGVSESTLLKANSDYQNRMGQIASDVGARQMDLLKSYNSGVLDIDTKLKNANMATLNKYQEIERKAQDDAYNGALIDITSSSINNEQEMLEFLEGYRGSVSEEQFNNLVQTGKNQVTNNINTIREQQKALISDHIDNNMLSDINNFYYDKDGKELLTEDGKNKIKQYIEDNKDILGDLYSTYMDKIDSMELYTNEQKTTDENKVKQAELDEKILKGEEFVSYEGNKYQIKEKVDKRANEIENNDNFIAELKKKCGTSDPFDKSIPNGTTVTFKANVAGKHDPQGFWSNAGRTLANLATMGWTEFLFNDNIGSRTMTYYNGDWYFSEKIN